MVKRAINELNRLEGLGLEPENVDIIKNEIENFFKYFVNSNYVEANSDLLIVPVRPENDKQELFIKANVTVNRDNDYTEQITFVLNLERLGFDEFLDEMNSQKRKIESGLIRLVT